MSLAMIMRMRAPGYNPPSCLAMMLAQWAHQFFLWEHITYEEYAILSKLAYRLFPNE